MNSIVKRFDSLPKIIKFIFAFPVLDIIWAIYRLIKKKKKKSVIATVLAVIMLVVCPILFWIVDMITILLFNKVLWIV